MNELFMIVCDAASSRATASNSKKSRCGKEETTKRRSEKSGEKALEHQLSRCVNRSVTSIRVRLSLNKPQESGSKAPSRETCASRSLNPIAIFLRFEIIN